VSGGWHDLNLEPEITLAIGELGYGADWVTARSALALQMARDVCLCMAEIDAGVQPRRMKVAASRLEAHRSRAETAG